MSARRRGGGESVKNQSTQDATATATSDNSVPDAVVVETQSEEGPAREGGFETMDVVGGLSSSDEVGGDGDEASDCSSSAGSVSRGKLGGNMSRNMPLDSSLFQDFILACNRCESQTTRKISHQREGVR